MKTLIPSSHSWAGVQGVAAVYAAVSSLTSATLSVGERSGAVGHCVGRVQLPPVIADSELGWELDWAVAVFA